MNLRFSIPMLAALALAATLPANASAAPALAATLDACHADSVQAARYATFGAEMSQIKTAHTMAVRFDLYERTVNEPFRPVAVPAPGFGVWHASAPGVEIFRYSQEVANLPAPARFRVQASYRWLSVRRRVVKHARRLTPVCVQPDAGPYLLAGQIVHRRDTTR